MDDDEIGERLREAMASGELQRAPSYGRPMPRDEAWHQTPAEFRLPFKILKDANCPPPEVALFQRRGELARRVAACTDEAERRALQQQLAELEQALALRLEGMRMSGRL